MQKLSQNKKIAISALAIFMISFTFMLFFLDQRLMDENTQGTNVFEATGHAEKAPDTLNGSETKTEEVQVVEPKIEPQMEPQIETKPESHPKLRKWLEEVYPEIKEIENGTSGRLMVDKVL